MEIKKNADFFPFVNAVELNRFVNFYFKATLHLLVRNSGRTNYNVTGFKDFG